MLGGRRIWRRKSAKYIVSQIIIQGFDLVEIEEEL